MEERLSVGSSKGYEPIYNVIGEGYRSQRKTDPVIFGQIAKLLEACQTVLNVGAGTGSYEPATCTLAAEPSLKMIAQRPKRSAPCVQAAAERLPVADKAFDGSLASLTIHHWSDVSAGLGEMRRVTRKRIVVFTWDPEYESDFWLTRDYLPEILELDRRRFQTITQLERILGKINVQPVLIPEACEDGFIGAYWKRPWAFLDPLIQRANSAMSSLAADVISKGIARLRNDLQAGEWSVRNAELQTLTRLDLGYRLIVSEST